jgi:hypothetical protein
VGAAGIYVPPENGVSDDGILAQGTLNESMWVSAAVDLAALRRLRTSGEMRNFGDWPSQPGAEPLKHTVETVTLA